MDFYIADNSLDALSSVATWTVQYANQDGRHENAYIIESIVEQVNYGGGCTAVAL